MLHNPLNDYSEMGQIFLKAADYIREHGHYKRAYHNPRTGAVCLFGALHQAIHGSYYMMTCDSAESELILKCSELVGDKVNMKVGRSCPPTSWNDRPERKPEEVIGLLTELAEEHKLVRA